MKITSSSIGTLQQLQASKHLYNYQWAWNAAVANVGTNNEVQVGANCSLSKESGGVKVTRTGNSPYADFHDQPTNGALGISGPLNKVDTAKAKWMHLIMDVEGYKRNTGAGFWGWGDSVTANPASPTGYEYQNFDLYYYWNTDDYIGTHCKKIIRKDNIAIFAFDMSDKESSLSSGAGGVTWENQDGIGEAPVIIEPYFNNIGSAGSYWIWYGAVLSDRILNDIPLPVATHVG